MFDAQVTRADFDAIARSPSSKRDELGRYERDLLDRLPARRERALDIGCGTGTMARALARRVNHVDAIDLSPAMLEEARRRSASADRVAYRLADVTAMEWPTESYDVIISVATLHHIPFEATLVKMRNALRPGGRLMVLDLFESKGLRDFLVDAVAFWVGGVRRLRSGRWRSDAVSRHAWKQHAEHDVFMTLEEIRGVTDRVLDGARVRRRLMWRYELIWTRP